MARNLLRCATKKDVFAPIAMSHQRKNVAFLRSKEEGDAATEKHHTFISNFRKKKKKSKQDDVDLFCVFLENGA